MDLKKHLGEAGQYLGTGFVFKDHPVWAFITIAVLFILSKVYNYLMRNHRILSDEYIDDKGNPRKTTFTDKH